MQIYPAIDIKGGKCVRLVQGNFNDVTVFNDDPCDQALQWVSKGASYIHIVDLDGARLGSSYNNDVIASIVSKVCIPIQVGGGIRTMDDIETKLNIGVSRVILGTAAINNPTFVKDAVRTYGDKIAIGIDAKEGKVAISGWEEISDVTAVSLCVKMADIGVKTVIYTDISKDGMMTGPNISATKQLIDLSGMDIIASGGVSSLRDLDDIKAIGASGVIIGKALYQGAIDLSKAIQLYQKL